MTDSAATEFNWTALLMDLSSMASNSKEQDTSLSEQRTYDNVTNWQYKQIRPFIRNSAESGSFPRQKTKRKQILSKWKVRAEAVEARSSVWVRRTCSSLQCGCKQNKSCLGFQNPLCLALKCFVPLKYQRYPQLFFICRIPCLMYGEKKKKRTSFSGHEVLFKMQTHI